MNFARKKVCLLVEMVFLRINMKLAQASVSYTSPRTIIEIISIHYLIIVSSISLSMTAQGKVLR